MFTSIISAQMAGLKPVAKSDPTLLPAVEQQAKAFSLTDAAITVLDGICRRWDANKRAPVAPEGSIPAELLSFGLVDRVFPAFGAMKIEPSRMMQKALAAPPVQRPTAKADAVATKRPAPPKMPPMKGPLLGNALGVRERTPAPAPRSSGAIDAFAAVAGARDARVTAKMAAPAPNPAPAPATTQRVTTQAEAEAQALEAWIIKNNAKIVAAVAARGVPLAPAATPAPAVPKAPAGRTLAAKTDPERFGLGAGVRILSVKNISDQPQPHMTVRTVPVTIRRTSR